MTLCLRIIPLLRKWRVLAQKLSVQSSLLYVFVTTFTTSVRGFTKDTSTCRFETFLELYEVKFVRYRRLTLQLNWIIPSSALLRCVWWFETDVSWLPSLRVMLSSWTTWYLKIGRVGSPETSFSKHLDPRNNPESRIIHYKVKSIAVVKILSLLGCYAMWLAWS
jgi:hypothetical protein